MYTYNANGLIISAKDIDNSHVDYEYNPGMPYRVSKVKEYSTANELGNSLSFAYGNNATTFIDNKGYSDTYSFTNAGNAVSIADFGNNTNDISKAYGKMYKYGISGSENNKLKLESKLTSPVINKLTNSSAEYDGNWTYTYWGVNNGSLSYSTDNSYFGGRSIKVVANGSNATSRNYGFQQIALEKGKTYTLSAYIKTEGITNNSGGGALPFIYYNAVSGFKTVDATAVNGTTDWQKYSCTFTYAADATDNPVISVGIKGENGTAYFDGIQLEEGEAANTYNLIENSGFDNSLASWTRNVDCNTTNDNVVSTSTGNALRITGEAAYMKNVSQRVNVSGKKGDIFSLSSWVKTNSIATDNVRMNYITAGIHRTDGTYQWADIKINPDSNSWQYVADEFITDSEYSYIDIYVTYYYNANDVYFDNISLLKDDFGQSYSYDKNGNLVATQDMAKQNSTIQYNGNDELLKETDAKGGNFVYEYDSQVKNRLLSAMNNSKIKYSFKYDEYGNTTTSMISNTDKVSSSIESGKSYFIRSKSSGLYFDTVGAGTINCTDVMQYMLHGGTNQQWKMIDTGDGYYTIKPVHAQNMALDLNIASKNNIQIYEDNLSDSQKFKFIKNSDGSFRIICKKNESDEVLTLVNDSKETGSFISEAKYENKESQSFYLEEVGVDNSEDKSVLESGEVFYVKSKCSNMYLDYTKDTNGNITDNNFNKLVQREYTGSDSQKWRIVRKGNGKYKLIPVISTTGRSLDLTGGLNQNDNQLQVYDYNETSINQEWAIYKNTDNTYRIVSNGTNSTKDMTVKNASTSAESQIVVYDTNYSDSQKWYLEPANMVDIEDGATYKIKNKNSGLYVGIKDGLDATGSNIEQVEAGDTLGQQWQFLDLKNGYYKIVAKNSITGRVIEVADGGTTNGTNIQLWDSNSTYAQQWEVVPTGNSTVYLKPRNVLGISTLDVLNSGTTTGTNIQLCNTNGSAAQQFYLEKVSGPTSEYIESNALYTANGRFLNKITDGAGKEINYSYNFNEANNTGSGTLASVTDAKGTTTSYQYDNLDRITSVIAVADGKTYTNSYTYVNDKLSSILHNGFNLNFVYDNFGNTKQVKVEDQVLVTNNYDVENGNLNSVVYGNNQTISYAYDRFGRMSTKTGTNGTYNYVYDAKGNLATTKDSVNNVNNSYTYDLADRLVKINTTNGFSSEYGYDANSNINKVVSKLNFTTNTINYMLDSDNKQTSVKIDIDKYAMYNYDKLSRLQDKTLKSGINSYKTSMAYVNNETNPLKTTTLLSSIKNGTGPEISYTYDDNGNITTISKDFNSNQRYYYDGLNQLIREDNLDLNQTISYTYDTGGNLQKKEIYEYTANPSLIGLAKLDTKIYTYDTIWKDKLTNYNGKEITYDSIGNPLTYDGNIFTWQNGRQLASVTKSQGTSAGLTEIFDLSKVRSNIVTGDYNGDGKDDIAAMYDCGNNQIKLIVWKSTGTGYSSGEVWYDSGINIFDSTRMAGTIVSGDYNGDGKDDIASFYNYSGAQTKIFVWTSTGTSFVWPQIWWDSGVGTYDASRMTGKVVSGDYNGDGKDDIAAFYDYGGGLTKAFMWASTGTNFVWPQMWWDSGVGTYDASRMTGKVISGDYNGDGKDDIAAFYDYGGGLTKAFMWASTGTNFIWPQIWWDSVPGTFDAPRITDTVSSGDYNGDGKDDITAFYDYSGAETNVCVWLSTGTSYSETSWKHYVAGTFDASKIKGRVSSGDYNGDGKDDISTLYNYGGINSSYLNFISTGSSFDNNTYYEWWKANSNDIYYKYNDSGIRTQKTINGVTTNYYLNGDKVIYETTGSNTIYYTYDAESNLIGFKYNNDQYYYVRNGQGDITEILDNNLNNVILYTYDTWGKLISIKNAAGVDVTNDITSIGNINPYRYRSYRYDSETGYYYLQSRYYNLDWGRFLNADTIGGEVGKLLSHNVFTYCLNNPVNMEDDTGHWPTWGQIFSAVAIVTITVATVCALVAAAPIIATVASMTFATVGLASAAATVTNVAVAAIATSVGICGVNRAVQAVTGKNYISKTVFKGNDNAYEKFESTVGVLGVSTLSAASAYNYPSTGKSQPSNLKEQVALKQVQSNPSAGKVIISSLKDSRMPGWMGWQKYSQKVQITGGKYDIHYVGNKYIPIFFDFKIK